ncbi:MAG: exodeoxyribonuclease VII small subunit [Microcystaceae cyanobacterium]
MPQIEKAIAEIESGNLLLQDIVTQFEEAVQKVCSCEEFLNYGQEQIELMIESLDEPIEF